MRYVFSHISDIVGVSRRTMHLSFSEALPECRHRHTLTRLALHCRHPWCDLVWLRLDGIGHGGQIFAYSYWWHHRSRKA